MRWTRGQCLGCVGEHGLGARAASGVESQLSYQMLSSRTQSHHGAAETNRWIPAGFWDVVGSGCA